VSISYSCLGKLGAESSLVSSDGEFKNVVRGCGDTAFCDEEVVCEEEGEDWCELRWHEKRIANA
jgi:hypothetical protein